jgi:hypothetical protein
MQFDAIKYALVTGLAVCAAGVPVASASGPMPVVQQNALVGKYCAVCHTDAIPNGGLSLQHFDAARPDPGLMAMIVSKLKSKALGASGQPLPDKVTQDLFQSTLAVESFGAETWVVGHEGAILTANVVAATPSTKSDGDPDLFRLRLICHTDTHQGGMQMAWSPGVPKSGQLISAAVDGGTPVTYKIEGVEKMGNGQAGESGPGSVQLGLALPARQLAVSNTFGDETVLFPFDGLSESARRGLAVCFGARK